MSGESTRNINSARVNRRGRIVELDDDSVKTRQRPTELGGYLKGSVVEAAEERPARASVMLREAWQRGNRGEEIGSGGHCQLKLERGDVDVWQHRAGCRERRATR